MLSESCPRLSLEPAFTECSVPVVFAANNSFVPMFAAAFQSLLAHTSEKNNYDVILLQTDVTEENKLLLSGLIGGRENVSLRFFEVSDLIREYDLKANAHISVETYFRFLIQTVLPDYGKVLYLDCDLIVNADVAELYQTDVEGYLLAAARDPEIAGHVNGAGREIRDHVVNTLKLKEPFDYIQAGVLLINETEMRKAFSLEQWLSFASVPYLFNDQDVLNIHCQGRIRFLDLSWNLITDCDHTRISNFIAHAPADIRKAYHAAHAAPKIIHYAGHRKPWHKPTEDLGYYFWHHLRETPYYEEVLYAMTQFAARECIKEDRRSRSLYWKLRRFVKKIVKRK